MIGSTGSTFSVGQLITSLNLDTTQFRAAMAQANSTMMKANATMATIGRNMSRYVTLPMLAAGGASIKMYMDFESSMSKIVGLVGVSRKQVEMWNDEVLRMAGEVGRAPEELADALFFVTSAGLRGAEAMEVLEMSGKASAAGLGETKVIADLLTSAINAYGKENLNAAQATDILVAAVREGKAEADELAGAMGMVLPIASAYGVQFNEVGAAFAGMTRTGTNARVAATQLKAILSAMASPALQAEDAMAKYGTSSEQFRKNITQKGLIGALTDLKEKVNDNKVAYAEIFPNIRALLGVLDLLGSNAEANIEIFRALEDATGSLDRAFEEASQTTEFKWNQAISQLKATLVTFGESLKGPFTNALGSVQEALKNAAEWFSKLSESEKEAAVRTAGLIAVVGPLLTIMSRLFKVMMANPYAVLATALIGITMHIARMVKQHRELVEGYHALEKANERVTKLYDEQTAEVKYLVGVIEDENRSNKDRKKAIDLLNQIMPDYTGYLTDEGKLIKHNKKAIDEYITSLRDKIKLQVYEEEYKKYLEKQVKAERELKEAQDARTKTLLDWGEAGYDTYEQITTAQGIYSQGINKLQETENEEYAALLKANTELTIAQQNYRNATEAVGDFEDSLDSLYTTMGKGAGEEPSGGGGGGDGTGTNGIGEPLEEPEIILPEFKKDFYSEALDDIMSDFGQWGSNMMGIYEGIDKHRREIEDTWIAHLRGLIDRRNEMEIEAADDRIKKEKEERDKKIQYAQEYFTLASQAFSSLAEAVEANKQRELSAVGDNARRREEIEEKYLRKQKTLMIAEATMNTAVAVTNALKTEPFIPMGLIAAGIAAVAGGAEIYTIASTDFAMGGLVYGETVGRMGEYSGVRSNPEVIAPLDKLKQYMPQFDGKNKVIELRLKGRDAYAMIKLEDLIQNTF